MTTSEQGFQRGRPGTRDTPYYTLVLGCREEEVSLLHLRELPRAQRSISTKKNKKTALRPPRMQGFLKEGAVTTYTDRPPITATSLDETPLIVEIREELPAVK